MDDNDIIASLQRRAHDPAVATDEGYDITDAQGRPVLYVAAAIASRAEILRFKATVVHDALGLLRGTSEVGNGGFGPGYGLLSSAAVETECRKLLDLHSWWPKGIWPIVHWGCAILSCVDLQSARLRILRYEPDIDEAQARALLGPLYVAPQLLPEAESQPAGGVAARCHALRDAAIRNPRSARRWRLTCRCS